MTSADDPGLAEPVSSHGDLGSGRVRDYLAWHAAYDDPMSDLSSRLRVVRAEIAASLDRTAPSPVRVLSLCAGDGRDLLGVLADREDRHRVSGVLVEILDSLAERAEGEIARLGMDHRLAVRRADAGTTDAFVGAVPADLVLVVGVMGNISATDIERLVHTTRSLTAPGATVIWTRGVMETDLGPEITGWFADAGFVQDRLVEDIEGTGMRVGVERLTAEPTSFQPGRPIFTFVR